MSKPDGQNDGTQAIRRAATILRHIAKSPQSGATVRDISELMDLSRSTAHRILKCLVDEQLVAQSSDAKRYTIGELTAELGLAAPGRNMAVLNFRPVIEAIARETGATTYLIGRSGNESVCLDRIEATSVIRVIPVEVGQRRPLGVGAGATAILASLSDKDCEATIAAIEPYLARFTKMDVPGLRSAVKQIRETGVAESWSKVAEGVYGVGVAVRKDERPAAFALSIAVHESLATEGNIQRWKRCLKAAAEDYLSRS